MRSSCSTMRPRSTLDKHCDRKRMAVLVEKLSGHEARSFCDHDLVAVNTLVSEVIF
jgi:hypothetical protein